MEHVWAVQDGQRREIAAEGPPDDSHAVGVDVAWVRAGDRSQRDDLILKGDVGEAALDRALPDRSAGRCAATVGDNHAEPLVGEPLRLQESARAGKNLLTVRASVRAHHHRKLDRTRFVVLRQENGGANLMAAGAHQNGSGAHACRFGEIAQVCDFAPLR